MGQVKPGDIVRIHYTGSLEDGTVFDSSVITDPLEFTIGEGQVIVGLEEAVIGMNTGESKTVTIPVDKAYGPRRDDMILVISRDRIPSTMKPEPGQEMELRRRTDGQTFPVKIVEVSDTTVTLDANHQLAGKDLIFQIHLIEVR